MAKTPEQTGGQQPAVHTKQLIGARDDKKSLDYPGQWLGAKGAGTTLAADIEKMHTLLQGDELIEKQNAADRRDELAVKLQGACPVGWESWHQKDAIRNLGYNPVLDTWKQWRSMSDRVGDIPSPQKDQVDTLSGGKIKTRENDPRPGGQGPAVESQRPQAPIPGKSEQNPPEKKKKLPAGVYEEGTANPEVTAWFFDDEVGDPTGPFASKEDAEEARSLWANHLDGDDSGKDRFKELRDKGDAAGKSGTGSSTDEQSTESDKNSGGEPSSGDQKKSGGKKDKKDKK